MLLDSLGVCFHQEFIQPMVGLVEDLKVMAKDGTGQALVGVLEFLSQQDWPDIYNQIKTGALDERSERGHTMYLNNLMGGILCTRSQRVAGHRLGGRG